MVIFELENKVNEVIKSNITIPFSILKIIQSMAVKVNNIESVLKIVSRQKTISVNLAEVSYLKAWSNYTLINGIDLKVLSSRTLGYFQSQLSDSGFIKTHRSYSVNIDHIEKIDFRSRIITLSSGLEIPIARARKKYLKSLFLNSFSNQFCRINHTTLKNKTAHNTSLIGTRLIH